MQTPQFPSTGVAAFSVDVHAHYIPESYRQACIAAGLSQPDGMPAIPPWSEDNALRIMDSLSIQTAMLSISSPGVHFGDDRAARKLAREVNEFGANLVAKHPGRFGLFASLTLPDIDGALQEAAYALDVLKADGIVLETNHHGMYLGDSRLDGMFKELNNRKAVIFIHPTSPHCADCNTLALGYPTPMLEFMFETTRSVTNLILSGTLKKYPDLKVIVPHAGAALPIFSDRVVSMIPALGLPSAVSRDEYFGILKGLYFDLAGAPLPNLLPALLGIADPARIMYGSDTPFTPDMALKMLHEKIAQTEILSDEQKKMIFSGNARRLFSRLLLRQN